MKTISIKYLAIAIFLVTGAMVAFAQTSAMEDNTISPYFYIPSGDPATEKLPLKSTSAEVNIAGVIADVKVKQVYKNEGSKTIEAIYIFPGSTRAAVYAMKMTLGERTIEAKIEERKKARHDYEQARQNGQTASLLEQQRPNVFQMNVANIMPGELIVVELSYTELLIPEEGVYEFIYPTVVGPRYSNTPAELASTSENWIANPYTYEGELPLYDFNLHVNLNAGLPIQDVACSTHETDISFNGPEKAKIDLKPSELSGGNRDFILRYRLQGKQIESGLMLYEGKEENFFLMMVQPPKQVKPENIPPREYIFIVDVSGSMNGFPLDVSKTLLRKLIGNLRPSDKFNVMLFAGGSEMFSQNSVGANARNISDALNFINRQRGGGGTELLPALEKALAIKGTEDFARTFIVATDGYVTVEREAYDLIRRNLGQANFFTFGIGSSVNRYLLEGMAHVGKGISFVATDKQEATTMAEKFNSYASNPVLTNIQIEFEEMDVYDVEPFEIPDVFSERPVLVYGKYTGKATGSVKLTGKTGNENYAWGMSINEAKPDQSNAAIVYLWARERIRLLDDYAFLAQNDEHVTEMTALGLKYNLLTAYTSFIAIDSEQRNENGEYSTIKQPLPLPEGVSNYAVGSSGAKAKMGKAIMGRVEIISNDAVYEDIALEIEQENWEDSTPIYSICEESPEFTGGQKALLEFIQKNMVYPIIAREKGFEGTVYVQFLVNTDGTIEAVQVVRGVHEFLDAEAIRVIKLTGGKWKPGKQRGIPVKTSMIIPIVFKL